MILYAISVNTSIRLVNKDFMDIVKDLAPDALSQIETIAGKPEAESGES